MHEQTNNSIVLIEKPEQYEYIMEEIGVENHPPGTTFFLPCPFKVSQAIEGNPPWGDGKRINFSTWKALRGLGL